MNLYLYIGKKIGGKSGIATTSVALSIFVILIAICVSEGFKREIGMKAAGFSGEIVLTVPGQDLTTYTYNLNTDLSFIDDIRSIKEVRSVEGVTYSVGMAKTDDQVSGVLFKGVGENYALDFFAPFLKEGRLPRFCDSPDKPSNEILISERMALQMGYTCGDAMIAYFVGDGNIKVRKFTITGIYDIRLENIDEVLVICDIRHTCRLNGWTPEEVSCIEIGLGGDGTAASASVRKRVMSVIDRIIMESDCEEDSPTIPRLIDEIYPNLFDWLELLNMNVLIILILMIAVAGFNMISGLLIILFRNMSMIGLMKALGMRTSDVCRIFLYKAGIIVLRGLIIGDLAALSVFLLQNRFHIMKLDPANYFVDHVPVHLGAEMFIILNIASFVVMMLIMTIPCRFISGVSPDRTIKAA